MDSGAGDDVSEEGKLGDTSVLDLDVSEALESLLVGVVKEAKRIEESERSLGSELGLEGVELGGGLAGLGMGEGGGGANDLQPPSTFQLLEGCPSPIQVFPGNT